MWDLRGSVNFARIKPPLNLSRFFYHIYSLIRRHRGYFYLSVAALFLFLLYIAGKIRFEEDISGLLPTGESSEKFQEVLRSASFSDKIVVYLHLKDEEGTALLKAYADSLQDHLERRCGPSLRKVQIKTGEEQLSGLLEYVGRNLPLFLDSTDYAAIDTLMRRAVISEKIAAAYESIRGPTALITVPYIREDPLGLVFMGMEKFRRLQSGDFFNIEDGYLISKDKKSLLAFITPRAAASETAENTRLVDELEAIIQELNGRAGGAVTIGHYGATPVAVANAAQIKADIRYTLLIALAVLVALYIYFYRRIYTPVIILLPALFGSLLGIAVLYWLRGTISAISIGIGSVLLGLTLDYSLHVLSHYRSTRDVRRLFESAAKPLLMCAVFTAVDFLCLMFLQSSVLQDLGIFAAVSVLGAAFFALVFMPHVYRPETLPKDRKTFIDQWAAYDLSRKKWAIAIGIFLVIISIFTSGKVKFDNDLSRLNYVPEHLQHAERTLDTLYRFSEKSLYVVAYGDTYEEAVEHNNQLYRELQQKEKKREILSFSSVGGILLSQEEQKRKIKAWELFWTEEKKAAVEQWLIEEGRPYGFKESTFRPFFLRLQHSYAVTDPAEDTLLQELFLDEFVQRKAGLSTITSVIKTDDTDVEPLISNLSEGVSNRVVIDRKHLQEKFLSHLEADFDKLFLISSIAVFAVLLLFFGNLEITLLTNIPIFLGWLVTLGLMGLLDIHFNAFNIIITTLIFGLGVDYAIFVSKGLLEEYTYGNTDMPAYKAGILLSAITTMLCFGVLVFAKHPAIRSISLIPLTGLLTVVWMSFTIQPWLFRTFILRPQEKGNTPRTLFHLFLTALTFGYFFLGGLLLSLLAQLLFPILPLKKKRKVYLFHKAVQVFFRILIYKTPFIKSRVIGQRPDHFKKPGILIANHTSILDTPTMGMLHPKLIFLVNDRVLKSPFFGKAIRMAGFMAASDSYEKIAEDMKDKAAAGYSIIIFPEGTRSMTSEPGRFHKGAFYLSEKLGMDIIPVLIHGNADRLPKKDNMLKAGTITLRVQARIPPPGKDGADAREDTRRILSGFKKDLREFRRHMEHPGYFKDKLLLNFRYKPAEIRKSVKRLFNSRKETYHALCRLLPLQGEILHLGCGYGTLDFLLVYDAGKRKITGWDPDINKIKAAANTYSAHRYAVHFTENPDFRKHYTVLLLSGDAFSDLWEREAARPSPEWLIFEDVPEEKQYLHTNNYIRMYCQNGISAYCRHEGGI